MFLFYGGLYFKRESFSNIHSFLRSLVILEVNKCLIFPLDFYVLILNFFPKKFVDFTTVILRLSFEIILKLMFHIFCVEYAVSGEQCPFVHTSMFFLQTLYLLSFEITYAKRKKKLEYSKVLRRRRKKITRNPFLQN